MLQVHRTKTTMRAMLRSLSLGFSWCLGATSINVSLQALANMLKEWPGLMAVLLGPHHFHVWLSLQKWAWWVVPSYCFEERRARDT